MFPLIRLAQAAAVGLAALLAGGCTSMKVMSYTERGVDLARYYTFAWGTVEDRPTGDPRLDNSPFFDKKIQEEVDRQLRRRGFLEVDLVHADVIVRYRATITDAIDVNGANRPEYCEEGDCEPYTYQSGTLLFELVERRTNHVIWRGWAEGTIDGIVNNQDWLEAKIVEIVSRVFEQLPVPIQVVE